MQALTPDKKTNRGTPRNEAYPELKAQNKEGK